MIRVYVVLADTPKELSGLTFLHNVPAAGCRAAANVKPVGEFLAMNQGEFPALLRSMADQLGVEVEPPQDRAPDLEDEPPALPSAAEPSADSSLPLDPPWWQSGGFGDEDMDPDAWRNELP